LGGSSAAIAEKAKVNKIAFRWVVMGM